MSVEIKKPAKIIIDVIIEKTIKSDPPDGTGKFQVENIYVEKVNGQPKLRIEYEE